MRPSDTPLRLGGLAALLCTTCLVPLDHEFDGDAGGPVPVDAAVATVARGCLPLAGSPVVTSLGGDLHSVADGDGGSLWLAGQATAADGGLALGATLEVGAGAQADCSGWTVRGVQATFDPSPIDPQGLLVAQDMVVAPGGPAAYYALFTSDPTMPFGLRLLGFGLAPRNATSGRFTPSSTLLWSGDRPGYGSSALAIDGTVYVHGCKSNAPLTDDCYVARADPSSLASSSGYSYWAGDRWSQNPDDATPVVQAGGSISVRTDPGGKARLIMTYVPPLGSMLVARSAIAPQGPWSAPVTVANCALDPAIPGAFCGGGEQHPELAGTAPRLVLSYDARTFATDAGATKGHWPQLVAFDVPGALP